MSSINIVKQNRYIGELSRTRTCFTCKKNFQLKSSIGQWECRIHDGAYEMTLDVYTCCGGTSRSKGCRKADHHEYPIFDQLEFKISHKYFYAEGDDDPICKQPPFDKSNKRFRIIETKDETYYMIKRYDNINYIDPSLVDMSFINRMYNC